MCIDSLHGLLESMYYIWVTDCVLQYMAGRMGWLTIKFTPPARQLLASRCQPRREAKSEFRDADAGWLWLPWPTVCCRRLLGKRLESCGLALKLNKDRR